MKEDEFEMEAEYDFSNAERGKFYRPGAVFHAPVYLEPDVDEYLTRLAEKSQIDMQDLVNQWLRVTMRLFDTVERVEA